MMNRRGFLTRAVWLPAAIATRSSSAALATPQRDAEPFAAGLDRAAEQIPGYTLAMSQGEDFSTMTIAGDLPLPAMLALLNLSFDA